MIEVSQKTVDRVYALLNGIKGGRGPTIALRNAVNRAMTAAQTETARAVTETYRIKQKDIKERTKTKTFKANQSIIEAGFEYAGGVIPLIKFQVTPSKPVSGRKRRYTKVSVMKANGATSLVDAYVADLGKYGPGVFERLTSNRASSQQLFGPSTPQMAGNSEVVERASARAQVVFDDRIEHEIERLLNGYGG